MPHITNQLHFTQKSAHEVLDANLEARVRPVFTYNHLFYPFVFESLYLSLLCLSAALLCYRGFQNYSLIRSTSCSCSTCYFGLGFQLQNLQDFIKISRALIKDIFPVAEANSESFRTDSKQKHKKSTLKSTLNMSTQLSSRTWPIRSVQVQLGSVAHPKSEPPLTAASGSEKDPEHRKANQDPPRTIPLTMEALTAHGEDSLQHLRRRVAASIARSAYPASSSTVLGGPEEQEDLRRRMDEYMLHEEYHKSIRGEDGEVPLEALGSPPQTQMGSFPYPGPSTDIAETASLPRRPRVHEYPRAWHPDLPALQGRLRRFWILSTQSQPMGLVSAAYDCLVSARSIVCFLFSGLLSCLDWQSLLLVCLLVSPGACWFYRKPKHSSKQYMQDTHIPRR